MPRTDRAERAVAAPPAAVFAALTQRDALLAWLPPTGMSGRFEAFDLRPGGSYRMVLTYDDPSGAPGKASDDHDIVDVRIAELVPDDRMVQEVDFVSDDPAFAGTMTMTWTVEPHALGSLVGIVADGVPDGISADDHAAGMASSLDNLARHLAGPVRS